MQLFRFSHPFSKQTGTILCADVLAEIGLTPCDGHTIFLPKRSKELIEFCKLNREFHIVSYMNANLKINKFVPGALFYFLADGDPNPQLIYATTLNEEDLEIFELRIAQTST